MNKEEILYETAGLVYTEHPKVIDAMVEYAKIYHEEQLRICAVSCQRGQLCDHTWKRSDNFSGKEYCSKCPEIRYK